MMESVYGKEWKAMGAETKSRADAEVSDSWRCRQEKEYRKKVQHIRDMWFVDNLDLHRIAIKSGLDVETVRGIISYRIAGAVE
jgi:hypothetical protein